MYVVGNVICSELETTIAVYKGIDMQNIAMDSSDAYRIAVENHISGGTDWAFGYHYLLQYYFMNGQEEDSVLAFVVRGISADNNEIMLYIDPYTQEVLQYLGKTGYDENGRSIWESADNSSENDAKEDTEPDDDKRMTREGIQEEYGFFELAKEYYMDPEELTDAFIDGIYGDRFDPFANTKSYDKEEWGS